MINTNVTYIEHSCFLVELPDCYLLFDYFKGEIPPLQPDKPLYAFASHFHQDHFSFALFPLLNTHNPTTFILSIDIKRKYNRNFFLKNGTSEAQYEAIHFIGANLELSLGKLNIKTLKSTDSGVAFLVTTPEGCIYHAGDLNWWTWEGETEEEYIEMTNAFQSEIDKLKSNTIDLAFLPLDSRQKDRYYLGFDYFMRHITVRQAYPMHLFGDNSYIDQLLQAECSKPYRDKIRDFRA